MSHRGGCGCDPHDGDGAGMLVGMPDGFLRKVAMDELGLELPPKGEYGVGNLFVAKDPEAIAAARALVNRTAKSRGLEVSEKCVCVWGGAD